MKKEIWKDIDDFNGDYQISTFGRIKSFKKCKGTIILKQHKGTDGYFQVILCKKKNHILNKYID